MHANLDVRSLNLTDLAHACAEESRRASTPSASPVNSCFELFRRAIQERDEQAWALAYEQYRRIILSWVSRNTLFYATGEEAEFFAHEAFARMWEYLTAEKFVRLPNLRSLLSYLKMCVNSVLVDYMRRLERPAEELTESIPNPQENGMEQLDRERLWRIIDTQLHDDKEWLVVRGLFVWGFKPGELYSHYQTIFRDVKEIYTIRENVLNRLRRDHQVKAFMESGT
jgi:hypothetical protein